jgi:hypothetical protein
VETGSLGLALFAAFGLVGGLWFETRWLLARRFDGYCLLGLPLGARLVPIPHVPEDEGRTATVRWELGPARADAPRIVRFWADPRARTALTGLHGAMILHRGPRGIELEVRWAPPWTLILAATWLVTLGIARGEAGLTVPIAVAMIAGVVVVYGERARRAAAELRWAFVSGSEPEPPNER